MDPNTLEASEVASQQRRASEVAPGKGAHRGPQRWTRTRLRHCKLLVEGALSRGIVTTLRDLLWPHQQWMLRSSPVEIAGISTSAESGPLRFGAECRGHRELQRLPLAVASGRGNAYPGAGGRVGWIGWESRVDWRVARVATGATMGNAISTLSEAVGSTRILFDTFQFSFNSATLVQVSSSGTPYNKGVLCEGVFFLSFVSTVARGGVSGIGFHGNEPQHSGSRQFSYRRVSSI